MNGCTNVHLAWTEIGMLAQSDKEKWNQITTRWWAHGAALIPQGTAKSNFTTSGLLHVHAWMRCVELRVWAGPVALEIHSVPTACSLCNCLCMLFPNALICSSCWSCTLTVTNSVNFISPTDVIDIWEMCPSFFQWHEWGSASFSAPSFSIPSRPQL